ncbi:MAG: ATP-binding protein [Rhodomicrobium sp.]
MTRAAENLAHSLAFEEDRLRTLYEFELLDTRPEPAFDRAAELARHIFKTPIAFISLMDKDRQWLKSQTGLQHTEAPRAFSFCHHAIQSEGIYIVQDAARCPLFAHNPLVTATPKIRFYAASPLRARNGHNIGTIGVADTTPRNFSDAESMILRCLGDIVVSEAEKRALKRRLVRRSIKLRLARRAADAANHAKSAFLSNIAHELRVPMHSIINLANIGRAKISRGLKQDSEKHLADIIGSGKRLLSLLNDLLDLDKLEAGKTRYDFLRSPLSEVAEIAQSELAPLLNMKNLKVELATAGCDCLATFDRRSMIQVAVNLLSNAIKFSPADSTITVSISNALLESGAPALLCCIADRGPGIPEQELAVIFDKFVQSSKTKPDQASTGLGLSICREIIAAHGGRIWAENRDPNGALLKFTLPSYIEKHDPIIHSHCGRDLFAGNTEERWSKANAEENPIRR